MASSRRYSAPLLPGGKPQPEPDRIVANAADHSFVKQLAPSSNRCQTSAVFLLLAGWSCLVPLAAVIFAIVAQRTWVISLAIAIAIYNILFKWLMLVLARLSVTHPRLYPQLATPPTVAVIIPAWNEAAALPRTLATVLAQDDAPDAIIVSDDGSTDSTIDHLTALYHIEFEARMGRSQIYPSLQLLSKVHSGKGDSINQAVAISDADVVLILDADTRLYPGSIRALRRSFSRYPDLSAMSGTLIPACSDSRRGRWFQFYQRYEYARQHLARMAWSYLNATLIVPGACSAFRRELLIEIGGFSLDSWGEDYEIIYRLQRYLRLHKRRCRVMVQPDLCVETDAPETVSSFLRQRRRWAAGFLDTLLKYRQMVGDRRFGLLGCGYLLHNTLTISTPIDSLAWLVAGLILSFNTSQRLDNPFAIVIVSTVLSILTSILTISAYRRYFGRQEVSPLGAVFDLLLRPIFYLPATALSQLWGYISYLQRQKDW